MKITKRWPGWIIEAENSDEEVHLNWLIDLIAPAQTVEAVGSMSVGESNTVLDAPERLIGFTKSLARPRG